MTIPSQFTGVSASHIHYRSIRSSATVAMAAELERASITYDVEPELELVDDTEAPFEQHNSGVGTKPEACHDPNAVTLTDGLRMEKNLKPGFRLTLQQRNPATLP